MAKSKSGGTRAMLRGRIANDVYSIGKDGEGKKQQVVRSLAETVANPRTTGQMRGRMIMSTVMQAVSALSQIVDHSFDGIAAGQPSISEFIRRNYALVKADVAAHPSGENEFGLNKYSEKGAKGGAYVISSGNARLGSQVSFIVEDEVLTGRVYISSTGTAQKIADQIGITGAGFVTFVVIDPEGKGRFFRVSVKSDADLTQTVTAENVSSFLDIDNPTGLNVAVSVETGYVTLKVMSFTDQRAHGVIQSVFANGSWAHSESTLVVDNADYTASVALPTYPVGEEKFLNGGDL